MGIHDLDNYLQCGLPKVYAVQVQRVTNGCDTNTEENAKDALRRLAPTQKPSVVAYHEFAACPTCGLLMWQTSKPADREEFYVDYQEDAWDDRVQYCENCLDCHRRNPELFNLVQRMIAHALHLDKKETE